MLFFLASCVVGITYINENGKGALVIIVVAGSSVFSIDSLSRNDFSSGSTYYTREPLSSDICLQFRASQAL